MKRADSFILTPLAAIALLLCTSTAYAHPHVFIDVVDTIVIDARGIAGVLQEWRLQSGFSLATEANYDVDANGVFDEAEQASVYDTTFLPLWLGNSLFRLTYDGVEYAATEVRDFKAEFVHGEVRFVFFIPCRVQQATPSVEIETITYDGSNYISFSLFDFRVDGAIGATYSIEFVPDAGIISHGPDGCGTRVRFALKRSEAASFAYEIGVGSLDKNLVPMTGTGPTPSGNPFFGTP